MKLSILSMLVVSFLFLENPRLAFAEEEAREERELSLEDQKILIRGRITDAEYVGGALLGTFPPPYWYSVISTRADLSFGTLALAGFFPGLGLGHFPQGRYLETGWKYTALEAGGLTLIYFTLRGCQGGENKCSESPLILLPFLPYFVVRGFEIVDLWSAPISHNRRYDALKKTGSEARLGLIVAGTRSLGLGLTLTF